VTDAATRSNAFLLRRALRTTEPMDVAGAAAAA
jgi:hypothetical protein